MITVSAEAAEHIKKTLKDSLGIRLGVVNAGCNGLAYKLERLYALEKEYIVVEKDGIYVSIEKDSYHYLKDTHIDFVKDGAQEYFVFTNPNQNGSCGCGETFNVD